jgi:prevent-host-death family protein
MVQTTTIGFRRNINEFQQQARREPVEITRHGRELVLMSAEHDDWFVAAARRSHTTAAHSVVINSVCRAKIDSEHAHLDELLK